MAEQPIQNANAEAPAKKLPPPPAITDPDYKTKLEAYRQDSLLPYIANKLYKGNAHAVIAAEYQKNKTDTVMQSVLSMCNSVTDDIGVVDFPVVLMTGLTVLKSLTDYLTSQGLEPLSEEETSMTAQTTFKSYLQMRKGQYDPAKLQVMLKKFEADYKSGAFGAPPTPQNEAFVEGAAQQQPAGGLLTQPKPVQ